MNILHIMEDYKPTIGGSVVRNSHMIENYIRLDENNHAMIVNLDGSKYDYCSKEDGVYVYRAVNLLQQIKIAAQIIKKYNIDIIQAHNFRFLFVAFLARLLSGGRNPIYVEIHAMYHMSWYKEALSRILLKKVNKIIVLAECAKQYLIDEYKLNPKKIFVVRNGIESNIKKEKISDLGFLEKISTLKNQYSIVLYTGSFYEWQGVNFISDEFDNILSNVPEIAIIMIGNGPDYNYVENNRLIARNKERILLHEGISKEEILTVYDMADIILIPRLKNLSTNTAVPLKAIEAMENCKCIVSANDNGLKEILNSNNSFMFESGDSKSLIDAIKKAFSDEENRKTVSKKAFEDSKEMFVSWETCSKIMDSLYAEEKVMGEKRRGKVPRNI